MIHSGCGVGTCETWAGLFLMPETSLVRAVTLIFRVGWRGSELYTLAIQTKGAFLSRSSEPGGPRLSGPFTPPYKMSEFDW